MPNSYQVQGLSARDQRPFRANSRKVEAGEVINALVVYETMFGNTEAIAREVASGLEYGGAHVTIRHIGSVDPTDIAAYDVVVAGTPTHAFSMPRPVTRADAVRNGADPVSDAPGLREWIEHLEPAVGARPSFAVFDTRRDLRARHLTGSAARSATRALRRRHRVLADVPASFYVSGTCGPLLPGEAVRARAWGSRLARSARVH
jgi:hypothetical protein